MKKCRFIGVLGVLFLLGSAFLVQAEEKAAGDFLIDALLGAGEGAIIGEASDGKAGKAALIGAGTALGREAVVKPLLKGGLQGGQATAPRTSTVTPTRVEQPTDPYTQGYRDGWEEGYSAGYKSGLQASTRR